MSETVPSVREVVANRIVNESLPYHRDDNYKVSLILQGGAMRGSVSAGAAVGLESIMGISEPFDQADVTSAGAFCWGTLASRNAVEGASIYYEELRNGFISLKRGVRGGKIVDLSLLVNAVTAGEKAFDFVRLLHHPTVTNIYASSVHDAEKVRFTFGEYALDDNKKDGHLHRCRTKEEIAVALEATAHLPFYAGQPVAMNDLLLMDGGLTAGRVPVQEAIADDCTHILIVATDKITDPEQYKRKWMEKVAVMAIRRKYPQLASRYWLGLERHVEALTIMKQAENGELSVPQIEVIKADSKDIPSSVETDPTKLYIAAKAGEKAVIRAFRDFDLPRNQSSRVRPPRYS